jgi:serine-type D-Ala-D-Ala carboxypeptidase/endopeptidase (penicillin-binding protein 4)
MTHDSTPGTHLYRRSVLGLLGVGAVAASFACSSPTSAGADLMPDSGSTDTASEGGGADGSAASELESRVHEVMQRPEFAGARWGAAFSHPGRQDPVYALNPDEPFVAASSIKIFVAGTVFATLGHDYRFHTRIYRTGPIVDGELQGDLVLVASGDLLL